MSSVRALPAEAARPAELWVPGRFELDYVTPERAVRGVALEEVWSAPFEHALPVRRFAARKGQRHLSGLWWSATTGGHVGFESWLERDHVMLLDFDPAVTGIASQPFWLRWPDQTGQPVSHAPDFFARRLDGSAVVVDCRPEERRGPRDAAKFEATARACARVGWEYRLVGTADQIVAANVRWLAGYRHPRHHQPEVAGVLRRVFAAPAPLMAGAEAAGDAIAALPVLFHLLWRHELTADLSVPLHPGILVSPGAVTR
jgi:TnsA-like endonuclease N terminal